MTNTRFNPLTGIRSFLTNACLPIQRILRFQSPHGDSFFSDAAGAYGNTTGING